jgi:hypothetical protein
MTKYIDADIFVTHCCNSCIKNGVSCCPTVDSCDYIEDLQAFLVDAPSADVAEVVRCKDCRYADGVYVLDSEPRYILCSKHRICVKPRGYCSYGERKIDGEKEGV